LKLPTFQNNKIDYATVNNIVGNDWNGILQVWELYFAKLFGF